MNVATYKRLYELIVKFVNNTYSEQEYREIHQILDDAMSYIEQEQLSEALYCDDFQIELERALSSTK
ncbi:hypothetical protein LP316_00465 [Thalassotalea sp. LPB0316]|uniref:hypothetical protein n=1 Tax=Thalassotalea sp. LPB0316 TaxID=2769490 RepID=UPI001868D2AB|nr:hypothetical protein [Thalassotalea sp. LPB0316]QOL25833.1 hypothetical protein LP316_00465 [Thalassotalea sp. LPB0316]